ncbi:NAD(P)-dependent oxidoreductase [Roseomonas eburnea]|uniref:NAD(P)-dependent oxidoreductase n=1 Tax=Neoroseomonas eburnea TaxID=1346889 RepID=A0A9X9XB41_9PROT|nr:NAD(P)-dependent oxidoreductase [Neoroseomonas eburnea]MBR0680927.1 NAD(P)-dependent oxidoreductase [Neoroseomonas eburnea]
MAVERIAFIGLGVMGGPMCRNLAAKHAGEVRAFDLNDAARAALQDSRARVTAEIAAVLDGADILLLSLPGAKQVEAVCATLPQTGKPGLLVVDLSTTTVASARRTAAMLDAAGMAFADAPVARTREAAVRGELSIMVGASDEVFARIRPLLGHMGTDVTHCGGIGTGQAVKLINNALVFEHVAALAEMMAIGDRAGVDPAVLLDAVSRGSGDSFVLRNHGRKAMLPREFPDRAFPSDYVLKDIAGMLELAGDAGVPARITETARDYYAEVVRRGCGSRYFPVVLELIAGRMDDPT